MIWKSCFFVECLIFQNNFASSIEFTSLHNNVIWILMNIHAPCTPAGKREFVRWFKNIQMPDVKEWLVIGDFNLIRKPEDRNKEGGDINEMFLFNEAINTLGLTELPLHGRRFKWTNKQPSPLLERLDWFFTSNAWTTNYPGTSVKSLVMETSDHWKSVIEIVTSIPKSRIFRFENHWLEREDFITVLLQGWNCQQSVTDPAKVLITKFNNLRKALKVWNARTPSLLNAVSNNKLILNLLDTIESFWDLTLMEWNFRERECVYKTNFPPKTTKELLEAMRENKLGQRRGCQYEIFPCSCHHQT